MIGIGEQPSGSKGEDNAGLSTGTKITLGIIAAIIIILVAAVLSLSVSATPIQQSAAFPFTTAYAVSFPEGETVSIGNTRILVLSYENEMVADVDGEREKLVVGEDRVFAPRHARITIPGFPLLDSDFQIFMKYKGAINNRAFFDLTVKTEKQVPEFLLSRLLPKEIEARPI